jgi:hypothetical protein
MELIQKQRATVAEHLGLENADNWSAVRLSVGQDQRAFYDFVPLERFKATEGLQQLYRSPPSQTWALRSG